MPIKIYKPVGLTPVELIRKYKKENSINEKVSFAGRLDPMAHGEMVLLQGEECKQQDSYCGRDKIYEFKILYGFHTDTLDILGISDKKTHPKNVLIDNFKGEYLQPYPLYSSKTISWNFYKNSVMNSVECRKIPLWKCASYCEFDESMIPVKKINIYELEKLGEEQYDNHTLLEMIVNKISLLSEEYRERFRYSNIKSLWETNLEAENMFKMEEYRTKVSSGTYIRSLCKRMGGIAYDIKRVAIL
jgi:tRNA U55 pseudouridine synthase TruB